MKNKQWFFLLILFSSIFFVACTATGGSSGLGELEISQGYVYHYQHSADTATYTCSYDTTPNFIPEAGYSGRLLDLSQDPILAEDIPEGLYLIEYYKDPDQTKCAALDCECTTNYLVKSFIPIE